MKQTLVFVPIALVALLLATYFARPEEWKAEYHRRKEIKDMYDCITLKSGSRICTMTPAMKAKYTFEPQVSAK